MKQATALFALLVGTSLTAGCGHCDPPETAVYWTFTDASNRTTASCSQAGVATLRIFVNDNPQYDVNGRQDLRCADYDAAGGAVVAAYTPKDVIQVEAYDASGNLLYLSQDTFATNSCGLKSYDANLTAQAGQINVSLTGFAQCPLNAYVWYSLTDVTDTANPVSFIVDGLHQNATSVPCAGSIPLGSFLFGTYRLDWIQIVQATNSATQPYAAVYQNCTPQNWPHGADDTFTVPLVPATTVCGQ